MTDTKLREAEKQIRNAAEEGPYYTAMVAKDDLRTLLAGLDEARAIALDAPSRTDADEPQAFPIPCAVRVGAQEFKAGASFCDVIDKALTDLDIAQALLIRAASSLDDTGNTENALLIKQIDRFLTDKWNDSEAA